MDGQVVIEDRQDHPGPRTLIGTSEDGELLMFQVRCTPYRRTVPRPSQAPVVLVVVRSLLVLLQVDGVKMYKRGVTILQVMS
jgi:hypothetical protein